MSLSQPIQGPSDASVNVCRCKDGFTRRASASRFDLLVQRREVADGFEIRLKERGYPGELIVG